MGAPTYASQNCYGRDRNVRSIDVSRLERRRAERRGATRASRGDESEREIPPQTRDAVALGGSVARAESERRGSGGGARRGDPETGWVITRGISTRSR
ncbi:hypothetical protein ACFQHN_03090 [Natrialbaceae archaeon GCM10025896]